MKYFETGEILHLFRQDMAEWLESWYSGGKRKLFDYGKLKGNVLE